MRKTQLIEGIEEGEIGTVVKVDLRPDHVRQETRYPSTRRSTSEGLSPESFDRMVHANTNLRVCKVAKCLTFHDIRDVAPFVATDERGPLEVDFAHRMALGESDDERIGVRDDVQITHFTWQRIPVQVPHRDIDAPNDFDAITSNSPQVAVDEERRSRSST